ncbi:hypothetical protein NOCA2530007 [metagenome]|uniref:Uncharacterized protein n=1 Tax=metagenome TaxID=256318 RepID=A0A2P2C9G6_9ZZZZ
MYNLPNQEMFGVFQREMLREAENRRQVRAARQARREARRRLARRFNG